MKWVQLNCRISDTTISSFGEDFGKLHHLAQVLLTKARAELLRQLSRQQYDNLLTVDGPLLAQHFMDDPFADAPVEQGKAGVDGRGDASTRLTDDLANIFEQDRWDYAESIACWLPLGLPSPHNLFSNRSLRLWVRLHPAARR